ncbi:MAG: CAP domain-containing protein [Bacteroidetes bacterium]|nr:CAP domain-containing protein [Bacteroidota bacterium]
MHKPLLLVLLLMLAVSCSEENGPVSPPINPGISEIESRVHQLINQYRVEEGLTPLTRSDIITMQARAHSNDIADGSVPFSHDGFEQRVETIKAEIAIAGAAENVAMNSGYSDPASISVEKWIESDTHRTNIEGNYDLTGIGVAQAASGAYYLTQIFVKTR